MVVIKALGAISKIVGDKPTVAEEKNGTIQVVDEGRVMCFTIGPGSLQAMVKGLAGQVKKGRIVRGTPEPDVEQCFDVDLLKKALSVFPAKTTVRIGVTPYAEGDVGLLHIRGSTLPSFNGEVLNVFLCKAIEEPEADGSRPSDRLVLTTEDMMDDMIIEER